MDDVAVLVRDDLDLDVARPLHVALDVHVSIAEGGERLRRGGAVHLRELLLLPDDLHPAPAASRGRLEDHRKADLLREPSQVALVLHHAFATRQLREPAFLHRFLGADLVAHHPDHLRAWADPAQAGVLDHLREFGVFAEEAVAGVDGVGPAHLRRGEDGGNVEIALFRWRRTDAERLVRESDVRSEEHTSELQSLAYLVCRLLLEKKKKNRTTVV